MNKLLNYKIELLVLIAGLIASIGYNFIPIKLLILGFCGIVGTILVLWKLEIGLFSAVILLPFLPTMALVGLIILIVISFMIRCITNSIIIKYSPLFLPLVILSLAVTISSLFSVTPASSIKVALVMLSYLALYFVIINTITSKKMLYLLILSLLFSASLESLYAIYQYFGGISTVDQNWTDAELFPEMRTRVFGTLDNPNILAQYLELIIPLSFGMFLITKNLFKKLMFLGFTGIMLLCLLLTFSRGGWIAVVLSFIVFAILKDRRLLLLMGAFGIASLPFLPTSIIERISSIGNLGESSNSYRIFIWTLSFNIIKEYWMSGVGLGVEAFQKVYSTFFIREGVYAYHSHNLYIQILVEMGILGFLAFITVVYKAFKYAFNTLLNIYDEFSQVAVISLTAGLVGFLFHGITENSFYNFKVVFLFWFVISLILSVHEMKLETQKLHN